MKAFSRLDTLERPEAFPSDQDSTYRLIVLDQPREMELLGTDEYRSGEVFLINVTEAAELAQYEGQHLTFSIDPSTCRWPSDTSLPVGQPSTADVHVLN